MVYADSTIRSADLPPLMRHALLIVVSAGLGFAPPLMPTLHPPAYAQTVSTAVQRGYTLLGQGAVDQAIAVFERALRSTPNSVEAQLGLAIAYRRAGRDEDAFNAYERVLALDSSNRLALAALGVLGEFRPEWQQRGIAALTTLLNLDPGDTGARAQRALLYIFQGQFDAAIADYEIVLQQNTAPEVLIGAAQAYTFSGQYEVGIGLFRQFAATGTPFQPDQAIAYGIALREMGLAQQAIPVLEQTLVQTPAAAAAAARLRGALASAYAANQQVNQALAVLSPLPSRGDSRLILARAYQDLERYTGDPSFLQTAAQWYQQALLATPDLTSGVAREVADAFSIIPGYEQEALNIYQQLVQQYPSDRTLQMQLAVTEYQLNLIAASDLTSRLQTLLQPPPTDANDQRIVAQTLIRIDPPLPDLLGTYQTVAQLENSDPFLYFRIAQIYNQLGQYETAKQALSNYSSSAAGQRDIYSSLLLLADIERQQGNLDLSSQRYEVILGANLRDSQLITGALQGLAAVRQAQGRIDEALALYDQVVALNPQDPAKQLGRVALAYEGDRISEAEAVATLNQWLTAQGTSGQFPPELFSLVSILPAAPEREPLYDALLQLEPDNIPIYIRKVQVVAQRDPELAQALVEVLVLQRPDDLNVYFVQGEVAQAAGDLTLAKQVYEFILSQEPTNIGALQSLGGVQFQRRQFTSATRLYNRALALNPQNSEARMVLADLAVVRGYRLRAIEQLEQWQLEQWSQGIYDPEIAEQLQRIREGYLQQRGFQPPWERF
ncbi:MAG: tetratricopeptide repeat protein [Cyanothece sp. SIO2G6]|nr:tetratricopeptide repeat protein [Cyanothece sp. SIO2G6]